MFKRGFNAIFLFTLLDFGDYLGVLGLKLKNIQSVLEEFLKKGGLILERNDINIFCILREREREAKRKREHDSPLLIKFHFLLWRSCGAFMALGSCSGGYGTGVLA